MMENGVENDVGSYLSEKKNEEDRVFEEKVEDVGVGVGGVDESKDSELDENFEERIEDTGVGVGAADESKDSEGEETFEEAIEQLQEQPLILDSDTVDSVDGGNSESRAVLGSGPGVVDGNSDVETFEEAIGVEDTFHEEGKVSVDEKVDNLEDNGKDLIQGADEISAVVTDTDVPFDESNGSLVDVENVEDSEVAANGGTHIVENGFGLGIVLEDSGYGDWNDVNREVEIVADKPDEQSNGDIIHQDDKSEHLKGGSLDIDHPNGQIVEEKILSNGFTLDHEDDATEEAKVLDSVETENHDDEVGEVEVVSPSVVTRDAEEAKEMNAFVALSDIEHEQGNVTKELNGDTTGVTSWIQAANSEVLNGALSDVEYELQDEIWELKQASASLDSGNHQDNSTKEVQENSDCSVEDNDKTDLKNTLTSVQPEHHIQSSTPNNSIDAPVEDNKVSPETGSPLSEKNLETLSGVPEDCRDSQAQKLAESLVEARSNSGLPKLPELNKSNHKVENKVIQGNGVPGVQSATEAVSASERSTDPTPAPTSTPTPTPVPTRPAGLGRAAPLLEPAPRVVQQSRVNGTVSQMQTQLTDDLTNGESEENDETREKLQMIRVKFLRLAHRLGQTPHNVVVAQVLYRLGLAEQLRGRNGGRVGGFSFDRASAMAEQLEAAGQEPLDFSCTIMVLGKTGVGKSATINSIFDEVKFGTDAFQLGTKKVQDVVGTVQGIRVRVIDTPGLLPSWSDQRQNEKILLSVKSFMKKTPPDIVLYLDRLDMQSRDFGDMPLLRTITEVFGPSIWFNAIVVLTHAGSAPPDGPNGTASSYDMFVTQRSHVVQQAIRGAAGDMRLMNPVSLVENHSACRTNRAGQRVLPNGQVWKPHLLLLSFASKILAEANILLKLQDSPPGQPFATRSRAPPLPFLLSNLLQSRPQLKLPEEQYGDDDNLDDDLEESSDLDEESEYDELPPFKPLTKAQLSNLTKAQKKAYFDEREYRENLLMKKQLREEKKRRRMMKEMEGTLKDLPNDYNDNAEEEGGGSASVPVPMPDLSLPASFDSDNPTHRYRYLDSNQWLVRPVLETHGWDHDVGYEGINVERLFAVKEKIPLSFSGQVTKDKKDANVQMDVACSIKHGKGKATSLAVDMQTVGKDMAYTLRSETNFSNYSRNKATAGVSFTLLGDALSAGLKLEDKLIVNKCLRLVMSGGAMAGRGDVAYGGSLEATLRDKDYPFGRWLSTLALSVMDWHGELAVGCNLQSQIPVGRHTNLIARANLNNRGSGQVSVRLNSSEQLQIALIGLIPLFKKLYGDFLQLQIGQ